MQEEEVCSEPWCQSTVEWIEVEGTLMALLVGFLQLLLESPHVFG
jgi:hypothetical protein